jgi:hypothetical protein
MQRGSEAADGGRGAAQALPKVLGQKGREEGAFLSSICSLWTGVLETTQTAELLPVLYFKNTFTSQPTEASGLEKLERNG